ncbi:DsrE family protein [Maribacter algicola]|nr:DsrE family protein [Maribacter algicola]
MIFGTQCLNAQNKSSGPIITDFGQVWKIENQDYTLDTSKTFKAVFDIMTSPDDLNQVNPSIETAARFLNMHGQNGIPLEQLKVALVVHNKASKDVISSDAYQKKFGTKNPNEALLKALMAANADVIFCGQSSVSRGVPKEELIDGVQLSLSAMTALIQLQDDNYRLIKF